MPARTAAPRGDLGCFATYSHPDDPINGTTVIRTAVNRKLDEFVSLFPKTRSSTHVFQSACRSVESARGNGVVEVEVGEVINDGRECVYQITRRVRDKANKVIEHQKSMTLALDKDTDQIEVRELDDYDALRGLEERVRENFAANTQTVPGQKIRNAIRDVLLALGAQNVRGKAGGLYFVPEKYRCDGKMRDTAPILDRLADLIADLYGERGDFFVIPAPDEDYMRKIVAKHFQINARAESQKVLEQALNRLRAGRGDRGLREDFLVGVGNDYRRLAGALEQFDRLVGVERKEIEANLHDLEKALGELEQLRGKEQ